MGSFNVACSVSGLSIGAGTPVAFFLLIPEKYQPEDGYARIGHEANIVSNQGSMALFEPVGLPVYGFYDDYGRVENVEDDENATAIADYFGMEIEKVCDFPRDRRDSHAPNPRETVAEDFFKMAGMFVHKEIYNRMVEIGFGMNRADTSYDTPKNRDFLEDLGFNFLEKRDDLERYKQVFTHPEVSSHVIISDGCWCHIAEAEHHKIVGGSCYKAVDVAMDWEKLTGVWLHPVDGIMADISHNWYAWREFRDNLMQAIDFNNAVVEDAERLKAQGVDVEAVGRIMAMQKGLQASTHMWGRYMPHFTDIYRDLIMSDDQVFAKKAVDFTDFYHAMHSCNRLFMPAMNGEQCGNNEAVLQLVSKTVEICKEEIAEKERDGWYD